MTNEQLDQLVIAIENLTYQVEQLQYNLKGDGGQTVGDSLEILVTLLDQQKKKPQ